MEALPKWVLVNHLPAIHDFESLTVIEQTARIYGAMNQLIEEYNKFAADLRNDVQNFETNVSKETEMFAIGLRQEFQDFIDVVELRLESQDQTLSDAVSNMEQITREIVNSAIKNGKIYITEKYDPETEELTINVSGGV